MRECVRRDQQQGEDERKGKDIRGEEDGSTMHP
jgi:hypothetical protein